MRVDEQKIAGASYILQFYREVEALTHNMAQYKNVMIELETKYIGGAKPEEAEKNIMTQTIQTVRYSVIKTFVRYQAIKRTIKVLKKGKWF